MLISHNTLEHFYNFKSKKYERKTCDKLFHGTEKLTDHIQNPGGALLLLLLLLIVFNFIDPQYRHRYKGKAFRNLLKAWYGSDWTLRQGLVTATTEKLCLRGNVYNQIKNKPSQNTNKKKSR